MAAPSQRRGVHIAAHAALAWTARLSRLAASRPWISDHAQVGATVVNALAAFALALQPVRAAWSLYSRAGCVYDQIKLPDCGSDESTLQ